MMREMSGSNFVYSTEHGKVCGECGRPPAGCACGSAKARVERERLAGLDGVVRVARETKGRKGAGVSLVHYVPLADDALKALAKELKKACGSGGTLKDGVIEIQGDHRDKLVRELERRGYTVKRVGG